MKWRYLFGIILFCVYNMSGQITSAIRFDKDSVGLGEPLTAEIIISVPQSCNPSAIKLPHPDSLLNLFYEKDSLLLEKYADWEILDAGKWKAKSDDKNTLEWSQLSPSLNNGLYSIKNSLKIAFYSAGLFRIPPPVVICKNQADIIQGKSVEILVLPPANFAARDSVELRPIRPIYTESMNLEDVLPYIIGILLALIVFAFWYFVWRKRKQNKNVPINSELPVVILPHEAALKALYELKQKQLWQQGKIKEYQSELTHIIRSYLEQRYDIPALEMTTMELRQKMYRQGLAQTDVNQLYEILSVADLVKFAKATPDAGIHEHFLNMAFDFVHNTKTEVKET